MDLDALINDAEAEKEEKKTTRRVVVKRNPPRGGSERGGGGNDLRSRLRGSDDRHGGSRRGDRWEHDRYDERRGGGRRGAASDGLALPALAPLAVQQDSRDARQILQAEAPHLLECDFARAVARAPCARAKELRKAGREPKHGVCGLR